jgi:hypothetical protein
VPNENYTYHSPVRESASPAPYNRIAESVGTESNPSIDTEVFTDEKKELLEFKVVTVTRIIAWVLAIGINGFIFYYTMYLFVEEEMYSQSFEYTWVFSFLFGQLIGFFLYSFIILFLLASMTMCCRNKKGCVLRVMRQSATVYEDYAYTLDFKSK